jgi:hypothetical protein
MSEPPRRWDDDSPEEDAEAYRAAELARLDAWVREQKRRPLTDALAEHGVQPGKPGGESWADQVITPDWWDEVAEPGAPCPWCQRPGVPAPCPECRRGRAADLDPPQLWAWWAALAPAARRLHIAATYHVDPWSGRHCAIYVEWTDVDAEDQLLTTRPLYAGCAPAGIWWGTRRRG